MFKNLIWRKKMKKFFSASFMTAFVFALMLIPGCGGDKGVTGSGGVDLFSFLPDTATGVIYVNVKAFASNKLFDTFIEKAKEKKPENAGRMFTDYQDFVTKTGIDPKRDFHALAVAVMGALEPGKEDVAMVANVDYDKEKVLAALKESEEVITEEEYDGVLILKKEGDDDVLTFVSENIVAVGNIDAVKKVIDLSKGKGKNVMSNDLLKGYIKKFKADDIASFVVEFPTDSKKVHDMGMAKIDLTKAEVILGGITYSGSAWTGEMAMICPNEEGNTQLVNTVNGLKGMAAMAGPEVGELVNNINLAASSDKVTLSFNIPDELLEKLQKKMEEKVKGMAPPPPPPTE
jgi:hypothetical protein